MSDENPLQEARAAAEAENREELQEYARRYFELKYKLPEFYRLAALERGRPSEPCRCRKCDCQLHTYSGDVGCIWCSNGQHRETVDAWTLLGSAVKAVADRVPFVRVVDGVQEASDDDETRALDRDEWKQRLGESRDWGEAESGSR